MRGLGYLELNGCLQIGEDCEDAVAHRQGLGGCLCSACRWGDEVPFSVVFLQWMAAREDVVK